MTRIVSIIFHFNTDYAEISRKELPVVVNKSYNMLLKGFESLETEGKICLNITGNTIDYLQKEFPENIDIIRSLIRNGIVELLVTGYSHPILPLLPIKRIQSQLISHISRIKELFGTTPLGCWPPELAISPVLLNEIKNLGINWVVIDHEHLLLSQLLGNDRNLFEKRHTTTTEILGNAFWSNKLGKLHAYFRAYKKIQNMNAALKKSLISLKISESSSLKAFVSSVSWSNSTQLALGHNTRLYSERKHIQAILKNSNPLLPLYASDAEFFGYRKVGLKIVPPTNFFSFLKLMKKTGISVSSPSQVPDINWSLGNAQIATTGSWSPDKSLRMWTESEDNQELMRCSDRIYQKLDKLNWDANIITRLEPLLRVMENSDARGWAPLVERKFEAYSAILTLNKYLNL